MSNAHDVLRAAPPRYARGVVVGRFLPPHSGHALVLDFARAYTPGLAVCLRARPDDALDAATRAAWLRELAPEAALHVVEDAGDADTLAARIRAAGVAPDVLFSSTPAQQALADALGVPHVAVDPARRLVPVESAAVRANPLRHWLFLPPAARAHYALRVAIVGPESTGKTTLAARLAAHFQTVWVGEYLRTWIDHKGLPVVPADVHAAARGQQAAEAAMARQAHRLLFCDTDLWMSVVYSAHYYGLAPGWLVEAARQQRRHLYLLLDADVPWVPDPQRDQPHARPLLRDRIRETLSREGQPFHLIRGSWDERFSQAVAHVHALLNTAQCHD